MLKRFLFIITCALCLSLPVNAVAQLSGPLRSNGEKNSRYGETVHEIFSMSDFPAPAAGVITLSSGLYQINNALSTSDRFASAPGASITFFTPDSRNVTITYTGTGTFFTFINAFRIGFTSNNFACSGVGAQFMDISSTVLEIDTGAVTMSGSGSTSIGEYSSGTIAIRNMFFFGYTDGLTLTDAARISVSELAMVGNLTGTGALINVCGSAGDFSEIRSSSLTTGASENAFYICPAMDKLMSITNTPDVGSGVYFGVGLTGPIASFTDVSTSAKAILSVSNDGGEALFESTAHGLVVGETSVQTTFSEGTYNVSAVVTSVLSANYYKIGVAYVSDDTGIFDTTTCQVNDVAHGRVNGTPLSIFNTLEFNAGYWVFNSLADSFEITLGFAFPGSETTGNWDTGSLDQRSPYISTITNGLEPNSQNKGNFLVGGNTDPVDIIITGTFYDLVLDSGAGIVASSVNEQWTVVDPATGAIRFNSVIPASVTYRALLTAYSAGASNIFAFRLMRSRAGGAYTELPSPDNVDCETGVAAALTSHYVQWSFVAELNDIYKMMVSNTNGTSDITIDTLKGSVE